MQDPKYLTISLFGDKKYLEKIKTIGIVDCSV